jgi:hypothetical protein
MDDQLRAYLDSMEEVEVTEEADVESEPKVRYDYAFFVLDSNGKTTYKSERYEQFRHGIRNVTGSEGERVLCFERRNVPVKSFSFTGQNIRWIPESVKMVSLERLTSLCEGSTT